MARRAWEESQAKVEAERQAEIDAREAERQAKEANRKRRADQTAKLNKRTKRGQPVLGFQVERMLDSIRRSQ